LSEPKAKGNSMPYEIKRLEDENIVIITYSEPFDYRQDFDLIKDSIALQADNIKGPLVDIHDARNLNIDFSKLVSALAGALLNRKKNYPHLTRTTTMGVGEGTLFDLAKKAAAQDQYGGRNILLFNTNEEAIEMARKMLNEATITDNSE